MRIYCEKAVRYGKQPLKNDSLPRNVTVILNPNANKRKAARNFEKYCAPILNLAGICVDIIQTDSEGHAKTIMNDLAPTDAVVVAGGDGTLSEVITGALRRTGEKPTNILPIGILPLGRTNTIAKALFPGGDYLEDVRSLADATLAVVEEVVKPVDIMRIEIVDSDAAEENKPVYAVSGIEWGAYRDAQVKKDSYWYFGNLRKYATYIFNGYKDNLNWNCEALIKYSAPCDGCSNCHISEKSTENKRWYNRFLSNKSPDKISTKINQHCKEVHEQTISTSDFGLLTSNMITDPEESESGIPKLRLNIGPQHIDYLDFVRQGWRSEQGQHRDISNVIEARQVEIHPSAVSDETKESWFSIDKEDFEVKPVRVTLLPKLINMFCKKGDLIAG
ncbi:sphingosine kinase [Holotrichia oblita]|uniref:Sphingosine kinase n=1 Tax=Holotrichia oblita TaxID=644536 RepID=A0ACB9T6Z9_HOLOL|nr:sphingosine kinase [Holotrichia oblita]